MKICSECHGEFQDTVQKCPTDNSELDTIHINPLLGSCLVDRYQILSMLGSGGTGVVYKAQHLKMDKPVAVKMMHSHMMAKPDALRNFYDEAKTVAQLKHHNIVTLYDFGISATNQPFLVMDYIEGPSLKKYTEINGPLPLEQMRPVLAQIVDGLTYAHSEGIVHQDLKPENIMLTSIGKSIDKITIVDFGLAALSSSDRDMALSSNKKKKFIGSPYYMSPEQCLSNMAIDSRSDIYSLAIVIYEALSGKLPFEQKSAMAMMESHVHEEPNAFKNSNAELLGLQVCTELTKIFNVAMTKEPDNRYKDIATFGAELDDALARDSVKVKAIRHRTLVAEQALVHVNQTMQSKHALETGQSETPKLQLDNGNQFLSRQADIEEAYRNMDSGAVDANIAKIMHNENNMVAKIVRKENSIIGFLKRLGGVCDDKENKAVVSNSEHTTSDQLVTECPNCKSPVKQGIQFCLNCQRKLAPLSRKSKMSQALNGNYFANHSTDAFALDEQQEAKTKLQNLRQQKIINLNKAQQFLNYALIAALIIGGIIIIQRYLISVTPEQNSINGFSTNSTLNNTVTNNNTVTDDNSATNDPSH